jgi:hypothetical protein
MGHVLENVAPAHGLVVECRGLGGAHDAIDQEADDGDQEDAGDTQRHDHLNQGHADMGRLAPCRTLAARNVVRRRHGKALMAEIVSLWVDPR